jgi:hypothetical protein
MEGGRVAFVAMIEQIGDFLLQNLVVLLAVVLVPTKLVILRICGDTEAQAGAMLAIPEDLCYVLLGLILADVTNSGGAFRKYFQASAHPVVNIFVVMGINLVLSILVHLLSKWSNSSFKTWRAATESRTRSDSRPIQQHLPIAMTDTERTVAALATPIIAVVAVFYVVYARIVGKKVMTPCPLGLEEAERIVEQRRAQMFGGPVREPSMAASWRLAYQYELERETDRVQKMARRYLSPA